MVRRASISLLLTVLLASSTSPSPPVILCIAGDGRVSLELALPGTTRCNERDCDPRIAGLADEHSCRDVPVLSGGHSIVPATSAASPSAHAAAVVSSPAPITARGGSQRAARDRLAPPGAERLRSVVLTL